MDLKKFGANISRIRQVYLPGKTINRAAQMALLTHTQLKNMEKGEWDARLSTVFQLAERWNVPLEEFFVSSKEEDSPKKRIIRLGG